jgi:hypothetical protein
VTILRLGRLTRGKNPWSQSQSGGFGAEKKAFAFAANQSMVSMDYTKSNIVKMRRILNSNQLFI